MTAPVVRIVRDDTGAKTLGLAKDGQVELKASTSNLSDEAAVFLQYVVHYLAKSKKKITSGETLAYGSWLVKFLDTENHTLDAYEFHVGEPDFVHGIDLASTIWREQHNLCDQVGAAFDAPQGDSLAVISKGILDGTHPVQGVRYPSPGHMSGWWLTTDLYDGDIKSLETIHLYHVMARRRDLFPYLALPNGFRFELLGPNNSTVKFDEDAATDVQSGG